MEAFAGVSPDLLSPSGAAVCGVLVSAMSGVKAGLHMFISPYHQLVEEVMSSGQLALICAAALCEKYRAGVEPKLTLAELLAVFLPSRSAFRHTTGTYHRVQHGCV